MVDNTSIATKSALQGCFSSADSLPLQAPSASSHNPFPGTLSHQVGSGGMKLEAVMENLQRQQAARLALEEKLREKEKDIRSIAESQIHQQALAFRHYQAAMRGALAGGVTNPSHGVTLPIMEVRRVDEDGDSSRPDSVTEGHEEGGETEEQEIMDGDEEDEDGDGLDRYQHAQSLVQGTGLVPTHMIARVPTAFDPARRSQSPSAQPQSQNHEWTYEEQFKQTPNQHLQNLSNVWYNQPNQQPLCKVEEILEEKEVEQAEFSHTPSVSDPFLHYVIDFLRRCYNYYVTFFGDKY